MPFANKLKPGDAIGFFSPASPATVTAPKRFARAQEFLAKQGFTLIPGALTGKQDGYRSAPIRERAAELNELFRNPHLHCIMSVMGGLNSNALLPYLDYEAFKQHPKILIGYSDVTAILLAVYARTGVITFYGPALVASFGEFPPFLELTFNSFRDVLMEATTPPYTYAPAPFWTDDFINWETFEQEKTRRPNAWITVNPGAATGRAIVGNLNAMTGIWGSPYMPEIRDGDILVIEDTGKTASLMEKLFSLLKNNGVFDRISGLILGKHERFDDQQTGLQPWDILLEVLGKCEFPILAQFDACHTHPLLTFPIGAAIHLDAAAQSVTITDQWLI